MAGQGGARHPQWGKASELFNPVRHGRIQINGIPGDARETNKKYDNQHQQQQQQQLMYQFCKEQLAVLPVASHFKGFVRSRRGAQSMSGRGRGNGRGRGRGRVQAGVSDGDTMEITNALPTGLNSAHHAHMDKVRAALEARWPELSTTEPLDIKHGGSQAVFRMDSFTKAFTSRGFYVATGNAAWLDPPLPSGAHALHGA